MLRMRVAWPVKTVEMTWPRDSATVSLKVFKWQTYSQKLRGFSEVH